MTTSPAAQRALFGTVYARGVCGQNRYALTFDDGPLRGATEAILDILKQHQAPATFFVIGENAEREPALIHRMAAEGHLVANHTFTHSRLSMFRERWYWRREIERADAVITSLIGRRSVWFRPPMGVRTPINMRVCRQTDHACILWTRRTMDGVRTTAGRIVERVMETAADGDVIVMHDGRERASRRDPQHTIDALPVLLQRMAERGLKPAPLDAMLQLPAYVEDRGTEAASNIAT